MTFKDNPTDSSQRTPPVRMEPGPEPAPASDPFASTVPASSVAAAKPTIVTQPEGLVGMILEGRYSIEEKLGEGGVGVVYLARDLKLLDKRVVIKVLLEKSLSNERIVQKFQQEKEALTRVDHPGIIGILDAGELPDGKPYIVMQYVDGVTLRSVIPVEGMGLERVARVMKQTGSALAAAHEKEIFHRDLKPENIMLQVLSGGEEQVKIIDFGVAKVKNSLVAGSTVVPMTAGTYWYMSPEQLRAERVTAASDIYALGVIAYEMVTGRRPFNPETVSQLSEMHRAGVRIKPKDLRPALPDEAQNVILKALSYQPQGRYRSAREFGDALEEALIGDREVVIRDLYEEVSAEKYPGEGELSKRKIRRAAVMISAVVAMTLFAVTAALVWSKFNSTGAEPGPAKSFTSAATTAERSLSYWLTVQQMRDGKPYKEPFESSGQEIFENGYGFRLNASSPQPGYLYVFNEGATDNGDMSFTIIYPTPSTNGGSAMLVENQAMQTSWNWFKGRPGTEEFWLAWSSSPVKELEAARDAAFKSEGKITDAAMVRVVREFLTSHANPATEAMRESVSKKTNLKGFGDVMVKLVELEHR